jgi:hypothetical protein
MHQVSWFRLVPALFCAGVFLGSAAAAGAQSDDPGVAFVSALNGDVSVQRGDSDDQVGAAVNAPLMVGDYLITGDDGRAEVGFDYGHFARVGPGSQLRFAQLNYSADTVQLAAGSVGVGVVHDTSQYVQIETPSVTIRPRTAGYYRVSVDDAGTTSITVRRGFASVLLPQGTRTLRAGSTMEVSGPADDPSVRYVHPYGYDSFDTWNDDRDAAFARSRAYQYAPSYIPGAYGLDSYGQWVSSPDYGDEWIPNNVPADWSPYSTGQWTNEPYYGWTWVDNNPWGYAPFHYGRWYRDQHRNRWAWTPGRRSAPRQYWAPALVAFIGFGGGSGIAISLTNSIAWVPLAPAEQPHPWWGANARAYNATSVPNIRTNYANARWSNAVRAVPRAQFATGGYQRTAPVAPANFSHAVVMRAALPVVPERQSLRYAQRAPAVAQPTAPVAAFRGFATVPHPPQTFVQARTQAAAAVAHPAPVAPAFQRPAAQTPVAPQRVQPPAFVRPAQPAAAPRTEAAPAFQRPAAQTPVAPERVQPPAFARPAQPAAAPHSEAAPAYQRPAAQAPVAPERVQPPAFVRPVQPATAVPPRSQAPPAFQRPAAQAPLVAPARPQVPAYVRPQPPAAATQPRVAPPAPAARPAAPVAHPPAAGAKTPLPFGDHPQGH